MSNARETNDAIPHGPHAVIEAFMDGEPVMPEALRYALADAAAREYLVDLLVVRQAVTTTGMPACRAIARRDRSSNRIRWFAAAAAVIVSLMAGFLAGQRGVQPVAAQSVEAAVHVETSPAAPKPTRVITLEPGVNWIEHAGGR
jgi:hypothetical protein